jgi:hypothetical protein
MLVEQLHPVLDIALGSAITPEHRGWALARDDLIHVSYRAQVQLTQIQGKGEEPILPRPSCSAPHDVATRDLAPSRRATAPLPTRPQLHARLSQLLSDEFRELAQLLAHDGSGSAAPGSAALMRVGDASAGGVLPLVSPSRLSELSSFAATFENAKSSSHHAESHGFSAGTLLGAPPTLAQMRCLQEILGDSSRYASIERFLQEEPQIDRNWVDFGIMALAFQKEPSPRLAKQIFQWFVALDSLHTIEMDEDQRDRIEAAIAQLSDDDGPGGMHHSSLFNPALEPCMQYLESHFLGAFMRSVHYFDD